MEQLPWVDWVIIAAYFIFSLTVGIVFTKKAGKDISSFFLGGRNLPWWIAGTSMVATTFGADTPLAVTEFVAKDGIAGNWFWWCYLSGGMLTTFFFARLWRRAGSVTDLEFIEMRYSGHGASFLRGFRAIYMGLFINILIMGWVNKALMTILEVFFNIPESELILYIGAAMLLVAIYSGLSGFLGVAITDFVQFIIAIIGSVILAFIVLNSDKIGGITGLKAQLPESTFNFFPKLGKESSTGESNVMALGLGSFLAYISMQWWASYYPGNEPGGGGYIVQRILSTKNEKHALIATFFFQLTHYCLRPWPWILVGLASLVLYPDITEKRLGYAMAMKDYLPDGFRGMLLVAFFAAYMSTISSHINWGSSYLVNDLYIRYIRPKASNKEQVASSRIITFITMAIALFATTFMNSISGVWEFMIECGAGLGLVLILRWYWWRINAWSEISATLAPFIGYAIARFALDYEFPESFFFTLSLTTITWLLVTWLTPPDTDYTLSTFYNKIKPEGYWKPVRQKLELPKPVSKIPMLLVCWFSSIFMAYAFLFMTGKFILLEWQEGFIFLAVFIVSLLILVYSSSKVKIFKD